MQLSISTKVTGACATVLAASVLLGAGGLQSGAEVATANEDIDNLITAKRLIKRSHLLGAVPGHC